MKILILLFTLPILSVAESLTFPSSPPNQSCIMNCEDDFRDAMAEAGRDWFDATLASSNNALACADSCSIFNMFCYRGCHIKFINDRALIDSQRRIQENSAKSALAACLPPCGFVPPF